MSPKKLRRDYTVKSEFVALGAASGYASGYGVRLPVIVHGEPPSESEQLAANADPEMLPVHCQLSDENEKSCLSMVPVAVFFKTTSAVQSNVTAQVCWATVHFPGAPHTDTFQVPAKLSQSVGAASGLVSLTLVELQAHAAPPTRRSHMIDHALARPHGSRNISGIVAEAPARVTYLAVSQTALLSTALAETERLNVAAAAAALLTHVRRNRRCLRQSLTTS